MPFAADDVRVDLACGPGPDGRWRGWFRIHIRAASLWRLGLHPDQPTARLRSPPAATRRWRPSSNC